MRCLPFLDDINLLFSNPQAIFPGCFLCQVNDKAEFQNANENGQVADCLPKIHCIEGSHFWPIWPKKLMNFQYKNGQTSGWLFYNFTLESKRGPFCWNNFSGFHSMYIFVKLTSSNRPLQTQNRYLINTPAMNPTNRKQLINPPPT